MCAGLRKVTQVQVKGRRDCDLKVVGTKFSTVDLLYLRLEPGYGFTVVWIVGYLLSDGEIEPPYFSFVL